MPVSQQYINQWQYSQSINRRVWDNQYTFENFVQNPTVSALGGGASSGTGGAVNILQFPYSTFEYSPKGTQTITAPVIASVGVGVSALNNEMDQTDNDGVEICAGILSSNPNAYKVAASSARPAGQASPFFFRTRVSLATVANTDDCAFGFRLAEAYQANIDDYNDMAVLNVISGNITIETILNGAATVSTDTTDNFTDGQTKDLKVMVDATGAVTYTIDGVAPTVTAAYTFRSAIYVVPFHFFLHSASAAVGIRILEWECGFGA
jgi:hypothetical protein